MTPPPADRNHPKRWTRTQIRSARQVPLGPVLEGLGYRLEPIGDGNCRVLGMPEEVIVKKNYWVCTGDGSAGNGIDLLMEMLHMGFSQAMTLLLS